MDCIFQRNGVFNTKSSGHETDATSDAVVTKTTLHIADLLGITATVLSSIVDVSEVTVSRIGKQ